MGSIFATKMKEQGPPICPACRFPVMRTDRVVEMQFDDPTMPDAQICLCMCCASMWSLAMDYSGEIVLCELSVAQRAGLPPLFVEARNSVIQNKGIAKALEVTMLELADMFDEHMMLKRKPRVRFDA